MRADGAMGAEEARVGGRELAAAAEAAMAGERASTNAACCFANSWCRASICAALVGARRSLRCSSSATQLCAKASLYKRAARAQTVPPHGSGSACALRTLANMRFTSSSVVGESGSRLRRFTCCTLAAPCTHLPPCMPDAAADDDAAAEESVEDADAEYCGSAATSIACAASLLCTAAHAVRLCSICLMRARISARRTCL
mmetsp:Transcript_48587/g.96892  ORF Transcript_48587/g.96892 Transcript_48587/m.96892 type:complete len:200 (-) Transcript_48587:3118-3717(-)